MGLLEDYEKQYSILTAEVTSSIGRLNIATSPGRCPISSFVAICSPISYFLWNFLDVRRNLIVEINRGIDESQEILEQIGLEISQNYDAPESMKKSQNTRLRSYKAELTRLEDEYNKTKSKTTVLNSLDDSSLEDFDITEDQKRSLLDNSERIERTGHNLDHAYRVAVETEEIGTHVLLNLSNQRDSIQRTRNRLRETNADLNRSSRVMNSMIMRSLRDRFALYLVGVVFFAGVTLTLYFTLKHWTQQLCSS